MGVSQGGGVRSLESLDLDRAPVGWEVKRGIPWAPWAEPATERRAAKGTA